jgi:SWI/SNF-related matrix-associated actin-dependent regulator of chromatin subfamily A member 5
LGKRWRALTDEQRQRYVDQEVKDRERFERESAEADALRLAEQEARQKSLFVQDGEDASKRGARARLQEERERSEKEKEERRLKREANMDEEERERRERIKEQKRLEYEERQRKRTAQDEALAKQHNKLSKEEARKASNRLEYLFKQSPIFAKLRMGVGNINDEDGDGEDADIDKKPTAAGRGQAGTNKALEKNRPHHIHDKDSADEMDDDEEEEGDQHVFLTQQPSVIKFGKLKPYQLESLNWMIHLAEKGLNGILADEMGLGKTLQSISILAYYYEFLKIQGPHLICVPKSTLSNWMNELNRWCPALRAIKFHGSREEREELVEEYFTPAAASHDGRRPDKQIPGEDGEMIDDNSDNPRKWGMSYCFYLVKPLFLKLFHLSCDITSQKMFLPFSNFPVRRRLRYNLRSLQHRAEDTSKVRLEVPCYRRSSSAKE